MFELFDPFILASYIESLGIYRKVEVAVDAKTAMLQRNEEEKLWVIIDRFETSEKTERQIDVQTRIFFLTHIQNTNDQSGAAAEKHALKLREALIGALYGRDLGNDSLEPLKYDKGAFLTKIEHHHWWLDEFTVLRNDEIITKEALNLLISMIGESRAQLNQEENDAKVKFSSHFKKENK